MSRPMLDLLELTKGWNRTDPIPKSEQARCRAIGKQLHELGGIELMREAYYRAKAANPDVHVIQAYLGRRRGMASVIREPARPAAPGSAGR